MPDEILQIPQGEIPPSLPNSENEISESLDVPVRIETTYTISWDIIEEPTTHDNSR